MLFAVAGDVHAVRLVGRDDVPFGLVGHTVAVGADAIGGSVDDDPTIGVAKRQGSRHVRANVVARNNNVRCGTQNDAVTLVRRNDVPLGLVGYAVAVGADPIELTLGLQLHAPSGVAKRKCAGGVRADVVAGHEVPIAPLMKMPSLPLAEITLRSAASATPSPLVPMRVNKSAPRAEHPHDDDAAPAVSERQLAGGIRADVVAGDHVVRRARAVDSDAIRARSG